MTIAREIRGAVTAALEALKPYIDKSSKLTWAPAHGVLPVVRSAILRRQYECLTVAAELVDRSQGFAAVALLRPACEEMLWTKYLAKIQRADAEQLLRLMGPKEIGDSLNAQEAYSGNQAMEALGLVKYQERSKAYMKTINRSIQILGKRLRWEKRTVEQCKLPSVYFVAKAVGDERLYRLLYHASSRYVHFSPAELLRRAWGKKGAVTVDSAHFTNYWGTFVLYWGVYLLSHTVMAADDLDSSPEEDDTIDTDKLLDAVKQIASFGQIPIVTAEELDWPEDERLPP